MGQYHLQLDFGDIGEYVLLPGDPGRCERIAAHLDEPRHVATNREYTTFAGSLDGVAVGVSSTGIGGPSAAIAVEELANLGVHTLIRVGTGGALQPELGHGDVVVAQAAVRGDGTSPHYAPTIFPAVADIDVAIALRAAAREAGRRHHLGIVASTDALYPELEADRMPLAAELTARSEVWRRCGCLAAEMECATVFIVGSVRRLRVGAVVGIVNESAQVATMPHDAGAIPLDATIATAVDGLRRLIAADRVLSSGSQRSRWVPPRGARAAKSWHQ